MRTATARMRRLSGRVGHFGILAAFTAFCTFPFYWMLITTFKETNELINPNINPFVLAQCAIGVNIIAVHYDFTDVVNQCSLTQGQTVV